MFWRAEGSRAQKGLFAAFWQGKCQVAESLRAFDESMLEAMDKACLYAEAPWLPLEDRNLEAGALLRIPSPSEVSRWSRDRRKAGDERKAVTEGIDPSELTDIDLPIGLPLAGFIRDSRSPIHIPEGVPIVSDVGKALAILARTHHGLFLFDGPLRSTLRLPPKLRLCSVYLGLRWRYCRQ